MKKKNKLGFPGVLDPDYFFPTKKQTDAMLWCIRNEIIVAPNPVGNYKLRIEVREPNKKSVSPKTYDHYEYHCQSYIIYEHLYEKYKNYKF